VQPLLWCFFSWRGRLNRQEFALAFFFLVLVTYLIGRVLVQNLVGPTDEGQPWTPDALAMAQTEAQLFAYVLTAWPTLTLQVKRLRDLGYSPLYLVGANIGVAVIMLIAPMIAIILAVVASLWLFFWPGKRA
jgi:uncharacterized membrane protein YhaH (DUF805 family)